MRISEFRHYEDRSVLNSQKHKDESERSGIIKRST